MTYGLEPLQPIDLTLKRAHSILKFNQDGEDLVQQLEHILKKTKLLLENLAQKSYNKQVYIGRCKVEYEVEQKMLNMKSFTMLEGLIQKFMFKFVGPFFIIQHMFKDVYELELRLEIKVHPT